MSKPTKIILVDADVISHFIACGSLIYLPKILAPHSIKILDKVYAEIKRISSRLAILDNLLQTVKNVEVLELEKQNLEVKREYALIKKNNPLIGDGERACMAVAKFNNNIIASSNFRDVAPYCKANKILWLGTLDILSIALMKGILNEKECNDFIATARKVNNAKFPSSVHQISDYKAPDLSFI